MYKILCFVFIVTVTAVSFTTADFCPGHKIRCQKDQTCCDDKEGSYGCCPYVNATCCSDGLHCCPQDTVCDLPHGRCKSTAEVVRQEFLIPAESVEDTSDSDEAENAIDHNNPIHNRFSFAWLGGGKQTCPDGKRKCSSTYTCCAEKSGGYACCPFKNGVCCSDFIHCCPQLHTCNLQTGRCDKV